MPVLRSSAQRSLFSSQEKCAPHPPTKSNFTVEDFKNEYDKIISNITTNDIKACLRTSPSEAKFYSDICRTELKKLEQDRHEVEKRIFVETDVNRKKDAEAARIVRNLWEEANIASKNKKPGSKKDQGLRPADVKKVWAEAKKLSNLSKQKRKKLLTQKNSLEAKINLCRQAIKFCQRYTEGSRKVT